MHRKALFLFLYLLFFTASPIFAQRATVTLTLDDKFFDALLEAVFKNGGTLDFPFDSQAETVSRVSRGSAFAVSRVSSCNEAISIRREMDGRRTAALLSDGKVLAPIAFSGIYKPPFLPCIEYSGIADSEVVLEFDRKIAVLAWAVESHGCFPLRNCWGRKLTCRPTRAEFDRQEGQSHNDRRTRQGFDDNSCSEFLQLADEGGRGQAQDNQGAPHIEHHLRVREVSGAVNKKP